MTDLGQTFGSSRGRSCLPIICVLCAAYAPFAVAERPQLRFLKTVELSGIGLKIKLMPYSHEAPQPPPTVYTYSITDGDRARKVDMYSPHELWRRTQHAGKWSDRYGNTLVIGIVSCLQPEGFTRQHVTHSEFDRKMTGARRVPDQWTAQLLTKWVQGFSGSRCARMQRVSRHPFRIKSLVTFSVDRGEPHLLAYAFRLNRAAAGQHKAPEAWFCVLFAVNRSVDIEKARENIIEDFFGSITCCRSSRKKDVGPSSVFQQREALNDPGRGQPEFLASRAEVVNSIRNMSGWWYVETGNYIVLSDLKTRYRVMVKQLQTNIEILRAAYEYVVPARTHISAVSVIRVFGTPAQYVRYVGARHEWSGGLWMPTRKELVVKPIDWGGSKDKRDRVFRTTYHEGFHQYLFYAMDQSTAAAWFNEGHAVLFENAVLRGRRLCMNEDEEKVCTLLQLIDSCGLNVRALLPMSYDEFYADDDHGRSGNYALAWAIVYYLRKGAAVDRTRRYSGILGKYCDALWETRDSSKATHAAFAGVDIDLFQQDLVRFWTSRNMRSKAKRHSLLRGAGIPGVR